MKKVIVLLFLIPLAALATEWQGTVIGIADGDTVKVLTEQKKQVKIRLAEIDAPESNQAFGTQSKKSLSDICFKKSVIVTDLGTDKYKRTLGRINCAGIDANAEQIKRGMAWAYRQYLRDQTLLQIEEAARQAKLGLWSEPTPTPPWEYRHSGKRGGDIGQSKLNSVQDEHIDNASCGSKRYCKEMASCEEAKFYLTQCGLSRLDGDGDGVPCEKICR